MEENWDSEEEAEVEGMGRSKRSSDPRALGIGFSSVCFLSSFSNVYFPWCELLLFSQSSQCNLSAEWGGAAIEPDFRAGTADRNWSI